MPTFFIRCIFETHLFLTVKTRNNILPLRNFARKKIACLLYGMGLR
jgi:hypothetical protein